MPATGTHRGRIPSLLWRILLVNILPLALIVAAMLYLDQYQQGLVAAEVSALREQARVYAGALAQSATSNGAATNTQGGAPSLNPDLAQPLLSQLIEPTPDALALIYGPDGQVIANSRVHPGPGGAITSEPLPPARPSGTFAAFVSSVFDPILSLFPGATIGTAPDGADGDADLQPDVRAALSLAQSGADEQAPPYIRRGPQRQLLITVAEPIERANTTMGVVLLTRDASAVDRSVFEVRVSILGLFTLALFITVLLSLYLSRTIAAPILKLANAAAHLREGRARAEPIPERLVERTDEIGTLARALDGSAKALWERMDAIERFAADVAHEIKNPLSSIRSAVETLARVEDPRRAGRLLAIVTQDVGRLDRLITDISDSSRLDAELSRTEMAVVDLAGVLATLKEIHDTTRHDDQPRMVLDAPGAGLLVRGVERRLVQVLRNLIGNAISFSPPGGLIWLRGRETGGMVEIAVEDEGPGIPEAKLDHVFDRFYSERPQGETFGSHSGLGLSISRQIVEAHQGRIAAENRRAEAAEVIGARFVIRLPRAE